MSALPRVALFTPLNPHRSGVSDYSEELLPHLARHLQVDVVIDDYLPTDAVSVEGCQVVSKTAFDPARRRYDGFIYQIANSLAHHGYMLDFMGRYPGLLVLHDYCLQYLVLGVTAFAGNLDALEVILERRHGAAARSLSRRLVMSQVDPYELSFAGPLIEASKGVMVHSRFALERLQQDFPEKLAEVVPMGVELEEPSPGSDALRREYGIDPSDFVLASISTMTYTKRLHLVLEAMKRLAPERANVKLLVVGSGPLGRREADLLRDPWLSQRVVRTGWVSSQTYRDLIGITDVTVDLRYPTGGETSASLLRSLGAGVPAILSDQGSFTEMPDTCCVKVPVDGREADTLSEVVSNLMRDEGAKLSLSAGARGHVERHHNLEGAAAGYAALLERMSGVSQEPVGPLFPSPTPLKGRMISSIYKLFRFLDLYRKYGLSDTLARTKAQLRAR